MTEEMKADSRAAVKHARETLKAARIGSARIERTLTQSSRVSRDATRVLRKAGYVR